MKKVFICFFCLYCFNVLSAQRNDEYYSHESIEHDDDYHPFEDDLIENSFENCIYWSLIPLTYQTFQMAYEKIIIKDHKRRGIMVTAGIVLTNKVNDTKRGFVGEGQYRFYFNQFHEKIDFFGAPYIQSDNVTITRSSGVEDGIFSLAGGLVFGGKLYIFEQGVIELTLGGGFRNSWVPEESASIYQRSKAFDFGYSGVSPRIGIQIGFAF